MRLNTTRQKIKVEGIPAIYADIGYLRSGEVKDIYLTTPSKYGNTAIGELIQAINKAFEEGFKELEGLKP